MSDYPAAAQNGALSVSGLYPVNKEHSVTGYLESAIKGFESAAAKFAKDCIVDAAQRDLYQSRIMAISDKVRAAVSSGKMTTKEGAEFCQEMRNKIMEEIRVATSARGRAKAEQLKLNAPTLEDLLSKYSKKLYGKEFSQLAEIEKSKVYYAIIESSGRSRASVNAATKDLRVAGKVCILVTATIALISIGVAENKEKEIIAQGATIGGGLAGGWVAGLTVSAFCGPGAPVCALAVVLVGGAIGGIAANEVISAYDEELEEFTKWGIR